MEYRTLENVYNMVDGRSQGHCFLEVKLAIAGVIAIIISC